MDAGQGLHGLETHTREAEPTTLSRLGLMSGIEPPPTCDSELRTTLPAEGSHRQKGCVMGEVPTKAVD